VGRSKATTPLTVLLKTFTDKHIILHALFCAGACVGADSGFMLGDGVWEGIRLVPAHVLSPAYC
jgi:hypothetical protein